MAPTRPRPAKSATRVIAAVCLAASLPACSAPGPGPVLTGSPQTGSAADPSGGTFFPWKPIDRAVAAGAIEHLVVASPTEEVGAQFRTYRLLGPRDQPGVLRVERTDAGLAITVSIGRFGEPELEAAVLASVERALQDAAAAP